MTLPLWCRLLDRTGKVVQSVARAEAILRAELLLAFLHEQHYEEFTLRTYSQLRAYLPGGVIFEGGLTSWESALLEHPAVPRSGRVLLAGAGGGRELLALGNRGYEVFAFEPSEELRQGAVEVASRFRGSCCVGGKYADLMRAPEGVGPLACATPPFDLVCFGWGSFTHLLNRAEQLAALRAARTLAPTAPLVLSFWVHWPQTGSRTERARARVRALLSRLSGRALTGNLDFDSRAGFGYCFAREEFEKLAADAGYSVEVYEDTGFPHALLLPAPSSGASDVGAASRSSTAKE
jgi:SAM-dependent methyltransferase